MSSKRLVASNGRARNSAVGATSGQSILRTASALPNGDHVTRLVPWSKVRKDEDSNAIGILPQALALRQNETFMSVSWNEHYPPPAKRQLLEVVRHFRDNFTINPKDMFAVAEIGKIKAVGKQHKQGIRVYYAPTKNKAHAAISQFEAGGLKLLEALTAEAFVDLYQNRDVPK